MVSSKKDSKENLRPRNPAASPSTTLKRPKKPKPSLKHDVGKKIAVSLTVNHHFGNADHPQGQFPLVLVLKIDRKFRPVKENIDKLQEFLPPEKAVAKDHSGDRDYHFMIFCRDENAARAVLSLNFFRNFQFYDNLRQAPVTIDQLLRKVAGGPTRKAITL